MTKLVCFDCNGTLASNATWYDLNMAMGVTPHEDKRLMRLYANGSLSYAEAQSRLASIYVSRGMGSKENITSVLSRFVLNDGVEETVSYLRNKKYPLAILSNSLDIFVDLVGQKLGIFRTAANNQLVFDALGMVSGIRTAEDQMSYKRNQLIRWSRELSVQLSDWVYIGDGEDDREVFSITAHGVTFTGSPLASVAWKTIRTLGDLRSVL